jgi:putative membrane-bound dehydrogenase-like protein
MFIMKHVLILSVSILVPLLTARAADGLVSKTTHAAAYGPTKNAVTVDPAKDLPRYPAVEPTDAVSTWQVKKGFKLELAANEPQVRDPIALCFDERGRMFVCEMIDYSEMRDVTPHLGRISVLEDVDGDGHFEKSTVFADDLPWPTGLIWANGGLYVGATPDIWRFEDRDGDGKAEVREKIYTGFGTGLKILNVQGLLNSFQWGQDNRVHVLAGGGNRGMITCLKRPDLKGMELGGKDFWFDPLTHEFGLEGGGAQYGMSFDNYGRKFACSNSDHLQYWLYDERDVAKNPYYTMPPARQSIAADGGAAEVFRISPDEPWRIMRTRWRIAGVVKGAVEGGGRVSGYFTGATGTTIYRGDAYGDEFVNNSFTGDAGGQLIHRKIIRYAEDGINLIGERPADEQGFEFAASKDTWVRVVNFANAPDGCLYVCDMYREVIEHPWSVPDEIKKHLDLNSGNDRGRIYRIVPEGWKSDSRRGNLAKASGEDLVMMLGHPNGWHRDAAQRLLVERQDKTMQPLLRQVFQTKGGVFHKIHAFTVLLGLKSLDEDSVRHALSDEDAFVRERAVQLASDAELKLISSLASDPSPRVKMTYAMRLSKSENATDQLLKLGQANAANAWITAAILNGVQKDADRLLKAIVEADQNELAGALTQSLLGIIGQQRQPKSLEYALSVLADEKMPEATRKLGIKAIAAGLRRAGSSILAVDTEGQLAAVFEKAAMTVKGSAESEKLEAIELLAVSSKDQAQAALLTCLKADQSEAVQVAALRALSELDGKDVGGLLSLWAGLKAKARETLLEVLLSRSEGALALLAEMESGRGGPTPWATPRELTASQVQALVKHQDAKIAALAKTVLAAVIPPSRAEVVKTYRPALTAKGDAAAGKQVFLARCMACHAAGGEGIEVGPNLITVKSKGRDGLLTAILEPHKEVASQYIAYTVVTKSGQTMMGIISQDEAKSMTLKMMGGALVTIPRADIKGSRSNGQSLMPEGIEQGMTVENMADLLAFIEQLQ